MSSVSRAVAQVRDGLEERNDVELRGGIGRARPIRERIDRRDVVGAPGEAHHVAMADARAEPLLQERDGAQGGNHLLGLG